MADLEMDWRPGCRCGACMRKREAYTRAREQQVAHRHNWYLTKDGIWKCSVCGKVQVL